MKKLTLTVLLLLPFFFSCSNPNNDDGNKPDDSRTELPASPEGYTLESQLQKFYGEWNLTESYAEKNDGFTQASPADSTQLRKIVSTEHLKFKLTDKEWPSSSNKATAFEDKVSLNFKKEEKKELRKTFFEKLTGIENLLGITYYKDDIAFWLDKYYIIKVVEDKAYMFTWRLINEWTEHSPINIYVYSRAGSEGSSSTGETEVLQGSYSIKEANNSTISWNNGDWQFTYNGQSKSGTYRQTDSEVTIYYGPYSAVFTSTKNTDGSVTLRAKPNQNYAATIISSVFMVTDQISLENETVTLNRK